MNFIRQVLAQVLTVVLLVSSPISTLAVDNTGVQAQTVLIDDQQVQVSILLDNATIRKVETLAGGVQTIATYHKQTQTLEVAQQGAPTRTITLKQNTSHTASVHAKSLVLPDARTRIVSRSDYWFGYGYSYSDNGIDRVWSIKNGSTGRRKSNITEEKSSEDDLNDYKNAVSEMRQQEAAFVAAVGTAVTSAATAYLTTGPALGTIVASLAALGATLTAAAVGFNAYEASLDAKDAYNRL